MPVLDLFLAATMRMSRDLEERLRSHSIQTALLNTARDAAKAAGVEDPRRNTIDLVISHFGIPSVGYPDRFLYDLVLWPLHQFEWKAADWGGATFDGFRLRVQEPPLGWLPLERSALQSTFHPFLHTQHDVSGSLGEPTVDLSWGHLGEWYYGPGPSGEDFRFEFDYGLLREVSIANGVVEKHRSMPNP